MIKKDTPKLNFNLNLLYLNVQCIRNKINFLEALTVDKYFNVVCLSEHWLNKKEVSDFVIENFNIKSYFCRETYKNGGVIILVKNSDFKQMNIKTLHHLENLSIEKDCEIAAILINEIKTVIINIYRSPSGDFSIFLETIEKLLNSIKTDFSIIIGGDFNVHFNKSENETVTLRLVQSFSITTTRSL